MTTRKDIIAPLLACVPASALAHPGLDAELVGAMVQLVLRGLAQPRGQKGLHCQFFPGGFFKSDFSFILGDFHTRWLYLKENKKVVGFHST